LLSIGFISLLTPSSHFSFLILGVACRKNVFGGPLLIKF
jgi:hypothetical protein